MNAQVCERNECYQAPNSSAAQVREIVYKIFFSCVPAYGIMIFSCYGRRRETRCKHMTINPSPIEFIIFFASGYQHTGATSVAPRREN